MCGSGLSSARRLRRGCRASGGRAARGLGPRGAAESGEQASGCGSKGSEGAAIPSQPRLLRRAEAMLRWAAARLARLVGVWDVGSQSGQLGSGVRGSFAEKWRGAGGGGGQQRSGGCPGGAARPDGAGSGAWLSGGQRAVRPGGGEGAQAPEEPPGPRADGWLFPAAQRVCAGTGWRGHGALGGARSVRGRQSAERTQPAPARRLLKASEARKSNRARETLNQ